MNKALPTKVPAQSLLRKTCKKCNGQSRLHPELYQEKNTCDKCLNTGYSGRTIISECHHLEMEGSVERILSDGKIKFTTLLEGAYQKYLDQVIDYDEFIRVFDSQGIAIIKERGSQEEHLAKIQDGDLDLIKQNAEHQCSAFISESS